MISKSTIKEIATKANVSVGTVDRVIHNRSDVSPKTREKVLKIIEEVDYKPNVFGRNLSLNKVFNVVIFLPRHDPSEYWSGPVRGVETSIKNLNSQGIRAEYVYYDQNNIQSFRSTALHVLSKKPEGILLAPVVHDETVEFLARCGESGIPVVLIDSDLPEADPICFIGQDAHRSGYLSAKLLSFGLGKDARFMIVSITNVFDNNLIIDERLGGFKSFFEEKGRDIPVEHSLTEDDPKLRGKLEEILQSNPSVAGIFVPNSKSHVVVGALDNVGLPIRVVGYDLIEKNKNCLLKDKIDFLIHQRPEEQGQKGVELLYRHMVLKQPVPRRIMIPLDIITKENA